MAVSSLNVGLIGLGTVGSRVAERMLTWQAQLARRAGVELCLRRVLVRDVDKPRTVDIGRELLTADASEPLDDPSIQVVVEVAVEVAAGGAVGDLGGAFAGVVAYGLVFGLIQRPMLDYMSRYPMLWMPVNAIAAVFGRLVGYKAPVRVQRRGEQRLDADSDHRRSGRDGNHSTGRIDSGAHSPCCIPRWPPRVDREPDGSKHVGKEKARFCRSWPSSPEAQCPGGRTRA